MNAKKIIFIALTTAIAATNASAGRWLSHDPIQEGAGFVQRDAPQNDGDYNLYGFVGNDGLNNADFLGLEWIIKRENKPRAEAWITSSSNTLMLLRARLAWILPITKSGRKQVTTSRASARNTQSQIQSILISANLRP